MYGKEFRVVVLLPSFFLSLSPRFPASIRSENIYSSLTRQSSWVTARCVIYILYVYKWRHSIFRVCAHTYMTHTSPRLFFRSFLSARGRVMYTVSLSFFPKGITDSRTLYGEKLYRVKGKCTLNPYYWFIVITFLFYRRMLVSNHMYIYKYAHTKNSTRDSLHWEKLCFSCLFIFIFFSSLFCF